MDGLRVGYLEQEPRLDAGHTVDENIRPALAHTQALLDEFEQVPALNPTAENGFYRVQKFCCMYTLTGRAHSLPFSAVHRSCCAVSWQLHGHPTASTSCKLQSFLGCAGHRTSGCVVPGEPLCEAGPRACGRQVSSAMAEDGADVDALMARMDRLQAEIDAREGWELERQLQRATDALRCPPGVCAGAAPGSRTCRLLAGPCLPACWDGAHSA